MEGTDTIQWLNEGDVSIKYQVFRDLLGEDRPELQQKIRKEGWGAQFLKHQNCYYCNFFALT